MLSDDTYQAQKLRDVDVCTGTERFLRGRFLDTQSFHSFGERGRRRSNKYRGTPGVSVMGCGGEGRGRCPKDGRGLAG
jgi:hypothetical protein